MRAPDIPVFLDRLTDAADYAVIGPVDGRRQVLDTRAAPFAAICHLERDFGDGRLSGCTGFLASPRLVVTAGHCVFSPIRRVVGAPFAPVSIQVIPGRSSPEGAPPFGAVNGRRWYAHRQFRRSAARPFDIGLIVLERDAEGPAPLRLTAPSDEELRRVRQTRLLHVSGYPSDKPRGTQWTHEERLDRKNARELFYSIDTCPGHSGAPVWVERAGDGARTVIGIHTAGPRPHERGVWGCRPGAPMAPQGMLNRGVRLTPEVLVAIQMFVSGASSPLFVQTGAAGVQGGQKDARS